MRIIWTVPSEREGTLGWFSRISQLSTAGRFGSAAPNWKWLGELHQRELGRGDFYKEKVEVRNYWLAIT